MRESRLALPGETVRTYDFTKGCVRIWLVVSLRYIDQVDKVCQMVILQHEEPLHGVGRDPE